MNDDIEWIIELEDLPLYFVSNYGNAYSKKNTRGNESKELKLLKPKISKYGYYTLELKDNTKKIYTKIHKLVAKTFLSNPDNLPVVDHKNRIRTDNRLSNLRWVTYRQNNLNSNIRKDNTSGIKGIRYRKERKCWIAYIYLENKKQLQKNFKTKEEAINWRLEMEKKYYK